MSTKRGGPSHAGNRTLTDVLTSNSKPASAMSASGVPLAPPGVNEVDHELLLVFGIGAGNQSEAFRTGSHQERPELGEVLIQAITCLPVRDARLRDRPQDVGRIVGLFVR